LLALSLAGLCWSLLIDSILIDYSSMVQKLQLVTVVCRVTIMEDLEMLGIKHLSRNFREWTRSHGRGKILLWKLSIAILTWEPNQRSVECC